MKTKSRVQTEQQFLYFLSQIVEMYPQYTIAQHLVHLLRKKNEIKESYFWSDDACLQKIEAYYEELKAELVNANEED